MHHQLLAPESPAAPKAERRPHSVTHHGVTLEDPYAWLKDPTYPEVKDEDILGYLRQENDYFESVMKPYEGLTETLFAEIKGRVKEDDAGVPWAEGAYDFYWAFAPGAQYRTWYYRPRAASPFAEGDWQVLLDETAEAGEREFFRLGALAVSPDGRYLAMSADTSGAERFAIRVKDLTTGLWHDTEVEESSGEVVWTSDSSAFYFVRVSKEWRPFLVCRQPLKGGKPVPLYEEKDASFFVHIAESSSKAQMMIRISDHVTAEVWSVPLAAETPKPVCVSPRRTHHDYFVDHGVDGFYVRSNKDHKNFGLYHTDDAASGEAAWVPVRMGDDRLYIHGFSLFKGFTVLEEREEGLDRIRILAAGGEHTVDFPEDVAEAAVGHNAEYDQPFVRLAYSSMITPATVYDYDVAARELAVRKVQEIPSGYDRDAYHTERVMIEARDGTLVPVSLVYRKDWIRGTAAPLHLYGYGAYGLGMSPSFSASRLSLLDRGFAYAIAHIRGGDELGYGWYEAGKLDHRTNTFNDFVDVAKGLIASGYTTAGHISISGGSAGGELMGAVANQAPELFRAVVLHVPFVDVLNTMLDADLPLTPIEWPEWGNPIEDKAAFETIRSYCPYMNIAAKAYPPMMVTGGLNDPRVTYWEPAKWTAKLRATKTDNNLLVMKINMGAGHGGKSGRFERLHEVAEEFTFVLMAFGKAD